MLKNHLWVGHHPICPKRLQEHDFLYLIQSYLNLVKGFPAFKVARSRRVVACNSPNFSINKKLKQMVHILFQLIQQNLTSLLLTKNDQITTNLNK